MSKLVRSLLISSALLLAGAGALAQEAQLPVLRDKIIPESNIEFFFQIPPGQKLYDGQVISGSSLGQPFGTEQKSLLHGLATLSWHILDNLGVPMFFGKGSSLDPGISDYSALPAPGPFTEITTIKTTIKQKRDGKQVDATVLPEGAPETPKASEHPEDILKKIPESELEGTIYDWPATPNVHQPAP